MPKITKDKKPEDVDLISRVSSYCATWDLLQKNQTVIIGLSGGPDSVFLLHTLSQLKESFSLTLIAAHLDHGWRKESTHDVQFCKNIAMQYGCPFEHAHAQDIYVTKKTSGSLEEKGRLLRRAFFEQIALSHFSSSIALAHHHDDQIETFFIRLMRGAGLTGLAGIRPKYKNYIRPLLCCSKAEILSFLHTHQLPYLEDPTNQDPRFLRNKIRNNIIPILRSCDSRFDTSLERTIRHLQEADDYCTVTIEKTLDQVSLIKEGQRLISLRPFLTLHPFLQKQILLAWLVEARVSFSISAGLLDEILRFFNNSKNKKHLLYHSWSIIKQNSYATLKKEREGA